MDAYKSLLCSVRKAIILENIYDLLDWDQRVMMPVGALEYRVAQVGVIKCIITEILSDPSIKEKLDLINIEELDAKGKANIREIKRLHCKYTCMTPQLTIEINENVSKAKAAWKEALAKKDFNVFLPWLEKIFTLAKEKASHCKGKEAYEVLLSDYTLISHDVVKKELERLKQTALRLIKKGECSSIDVPHTLQRPFIQQMLEQCGFDHTKGRLDESTRPFSVCHGRITVSYREWKKSIASALHEAGHGWYDQGLPVELFGQPIGCQRSSSLHETQAKFWEDCIGKNKPFWTYFFPILQKHYSPYFDDITFDEFYQNVICIEPKEKRLESDEVTYILHIILRYEIEVDVIEGRLEVKDIPQAWANKMKEYLGLDVEEDSCLQDIHWSLGGIGYFPAYIVGLMGAAQMYEAMLRDCPDVEKEISEGNFETVHAWLKEHVWDHGSFYEEDELIEKATGTTLSADAYISYLEKKFR